MMPPDSAVAGMQDEGMAEESGYTIEISVDGQGQITVGTGESEGDEGMEAESAQPVASIKEALAMALSIYRANGKPNTAAQDQQAGFDSAVEPGMGG